MSLDATRWAWQQAVRPTQKLVLLALADRADEEHKCYPSEARMRADTGLDKKTIMRSISALEEAGKLSVERRTGAVNIYRLIGVSDRQKPIPKKAPVPKTGLVPKTGPGPLPKTGVGTPKNGTGTTPKNGTLNLPVEPINNLPKESMAHAKGTATSKKPSGRKPKTTPPENFQITDTLREWIREEMLVVDIDQETEKFLDYHRAKDSRFASWEAAWRNWMRNADKYAKEDHRRKTKKAPRQTWQLSDGELIAGCQHLGLPTAGKTRAQLIAAIDGEAA